ncbi:MAG: hypothetical protein IJ193_02305 [Bacilli bacterium]|nr:hypothetical protein [Bacilli bacterium]
MKNKILVEIIVPTIEASYDLYIPINRRVGNIITLLNKTIQEMSEDCFIGTNNTSLYNRDTNHKYNPNDLIFNTDIRNGTSLILL